MKPLFLSVAIVFLTITKSLSFCSTTPPVPRIYSYGCELKCLTDITELPISGNWIYQWSCLNCNSTDLSDFTSNTIVPPCEGEYNCKITLISDSTCYSNTLNHQTGKYKFSSANNDGICVVTLDTSTNKNIIIWNNYNSNVDSFKVYKETSINNYTLLSSQSASSFSTYIDPTSEPESYSAKYKISVIDTCGTESRLSSYHETVLLQSNLGINNVVNLTWNSYVGFQVQMYEVWRSSNGGPFYVIDSVTSTSCIDNNPPTQANYQIRAIGNGCNPGVAKTNSYNEIVSNIINTQLTEVESIGIDKIKFYPNPSNGYINIDNANGERIVITNYLGGIIFESIINSDHQTINLCNFSKGIYVVNIKNFKAILPLQN